MTYKPPRYTMVPNELLDMDMKDMGKAELKILLATCRKTFGWQKERDRISYTQFEQLTGLSRSSVVDGINAGISRGVLRKHITKNGNEYSLNVDPFPDAVPVRGTSAVPVEGHTKESKQKKTTASPALSSYPADVVDVLQEFVDVFDRDPIEEEKAHWIKEARKWLKIGVTVDMVRDMYNHAKREGTAVKTPGSITYAYDEIRTAKSAEFKGKEY